MEEQLIREILSGSLGSFDQLMRKYESKVYSLAYGIARNKDDALDITQNVFLKVYEKLSTFSGRSSFKTWLMRITYNEGINWVKKNRHFKETVELDDLDELQDTSVIAQDDELLAMENKSVLIRSLFSLNTRYRLAVVLRYFQNMPIKEIAATLNCSEGVVKNMLFRSIQRLKIIMQQYNKGEVHGHL